MFRSAVGIGLTWAVTWGFVGGVTGVVRVLLGERFIFSGFLQSLLDLAWMSSVSFGMIGFFAGGAFSVVLGLSEGRPASIP